MTLDDPSEPAPPARVLGWVWIVAGGLAIAIGVFGTIAMVAVFGVVAVALGLGIQAVARLREKSRERTSRTLSGDPPPPATAPYRPPPPPPEPDPEPEPEGPAGDAGSEHDGAGTAPRESRIGAADVEDDDGVPVSEQDRPDRSPGPDDREGA